MSTSDVKKVSFDRIKPWELLNLLLSFPTNTTPEQWQPMADQPVRSDRGTKRCGNLETIWFQEDNLEAEGCMTEFTGAVSKLPAELWAGLSTERHWNRSRGGKDQRTPVATPSIPTAPKATGAASTSDGAVGQRRPTPGKCKVDDECGGRSVVAQPQAAPSGSNHLGLQPWPSEAAALRRSAPNLVPGLISGLPLTIIIQDRSNKAGEKHCSTSLAKGGKRAHSSSDSDSSSPPREVKRPRRASQPEGRHVPLPSGAASSSGPLHNDRLQALIAVRSSLEDAVIKKLKDGQPTNGVMRVLIKEFIHLAQDAAQFTDWH